MKDELSSAAHVTPPPTAGSGGTTAALAVDLQQVFAGPRGPWAVPGFEQAVSGCRRLLAAYDARAATRFVPHPAPEGAWADYDAAYPFARQAGPETWQLVPGAVPDGVPVVDAPTMGKWSPALAEALGHPETLLLGGVATECCVLATALAAADDGVRVRVVADACAGGTPADHAATLRVLAAFAPLVQVVTLADVC